MSGVRYLEHLNDADLALLVAGEGAGPPGESVARLRARPDLIEAQLWRPEVFAALFESAERDPFLRASPVLVFAVLVHKAARDLAQVSFVEEWVAPGRRVPLFDVAGLREFVGDSLRRLFLAELLASYTRVASGSFWVRGSRGWRRRRFSELDPVRLIELLDVVPEHDRPAVHRRLGDLALFLTGVFPDHSGEHLLPPRARGGLQRELAGSEARSVVPGDPSSAIWLLEELGRRSYRVAQRATQAQDAGMARVLGDVAQGFGQARRILNFLADCYVFPYRRHWFPVAEG